MIRLGLVMTRDIGFSEWERTGLLNREISLYKKLEGIQTTFFHDEDKVCQYSGFAFKPKSQMAGEDLDLIKSNQTYGAEVGLKEARRRKVPFILRGGYSWAKFLSRHKISVLKKIKYWFDEALTARRANACVVSNHEDAKLFSKWYGVPKSRIHVHPNWVDTDLFSPAQSLEKKPLILSIGRLAPQKNHDLLIRASSLVGGVPVRIIGEGPERDRLMSLAKQLDVALEILPYKSYEQLVEVYREASVFVLTSLYEGLPKVVLEAMSCGVPVISTPVQGVREVIQHGVTGYLSESNANSLAQAARLVLDEPHDDLASKARSLILDKYSLESVARLEKNLMIQLLGRSDD